MNIFSQNKIFAHPHVLVELQGGRVPSPITMSFTLTDKCNNKCPRCLEASGRLPSMPSLKNPERILEECADLGVKAVTFSGGGEPLVYPRAIEVMEYAKKLGMEVGLITNGYALDEDKIKRLLKICTWIRVSVDASSVDEYWATHGMFTEAFWIKVVNNIILLGKLKVKTKSKCTIGIGYLTGEVNRKGIVIAAQSWSHQPGIDYINFRPFQGDKIDFSKELTEAQKYETEAFQVLFKPHKYEEWWKITYPKCYFQYLYPLIAADGNLYPCCDMRGKKKYIIGSVYKNSLRQLWHKERKPIDFKDCMLNCIGHKTNQLLNEIFSKGEHSNFL